jgi:hypothetical protein
MRWLGAKFFRETGALNVLAWLESAAYKDLAKHFDNLPRSMLPPACPV